MSLTISAAVAALLAEELYVGECDLYHFIRVEVVSGRRYWHDASRWIGRSHRRRQVHPELVQS